ncbi:EamA family transporter RarD [Lysobacter fragariae]
MNPATENRTGLWVAVASFVLWGLMPLYWHLLKAVPSLQVVAHRVVWSTLLVVAWLAWKNGRAWLRTALARPRAAWMLALSGALIGFNWSLYIWAINAGHVVESSLGYFINPLLNVVLGVAFLHERLSRAQWAAVALAALGVGWLTVQFGQPPWIAICLALSFALYGLLRKLLSIDAVTGLGVESVYLFLPALVVLGWGETQGQGGFLPLPGAPGWGPGVAALLVFGGALTALPLIGFAFAVRRVPLSTVGLLQYIAPTLQFLTGVFVFHEAFGQDRLVGFLCIWSGLAVFAGESLWRSRRSAPMESSPLKSAPVMPVPAVSVAADETR